MERAALIPPGTECISNFDAGCRHGHAKEMLTNGARARQTIRHAQTTTSLPGDLETRLAQTRDVQGLLALIDGNQWQPYSRPIELSVGAELMSVFISALIFMYNYFLAVWLIRTFLGAHVGPTSMGGSPSPVVKTRRENVGEKSRKFSTGARLRAGNRFFVILSR